MFGDGSPLRLKMASWLPSQCVFIGPRPYVGVYVGVGEFGMVNGDF